MKGNPPTLDKVGPCPAAQRNPALSKFDLWRGPGAYRGRTYGKRGWAVKKKKKKERKKEKKVHEGNSGLNGNTLVATRSKIDKPRAATQIFEMDAHSQSLKVFEF